MHGTGLGDCTDAVPTELIFAPAADAIARRALRAWPASSFALAAMDIDAAFGSLGARREMLIGFLAEPALLMVFSPLR